MLLKLLKKFNWFCIQCSTWNFQSYLLFSCTPRYLQLGTSTTTSTGLGLFLQKFSTKSLVFEMLMLICKTLLKSGLDPFRYSTLVTSLVEWIHTTALALFYVFVFIFWTFRTNNRLMFIVHFSLWYFRIVLSQPIKVASIFNLASSSSS